METSLVPTGEYPDLLTYFATNSGSNHLLSLALGQLNDSTSSTMPPSPSIVVDFDLFGASGDAAEAPGSDGGGLLNATIETIETIASNRSLGGSASPRIASSVPIWLIPCYSVILLCAIVGNLLVISTLVQNRRMRTITNFFLLNLAISDILLGVLCMPVTLVGTLLRHFIFGEVLCKLLQFSQATSVAVSSWTLVAISCERYYAICHPLRSRTWQTINHAYKIIAFIWFGSIACMTPIAVFSQLMPTSRQGLKKCRDNWPLDSLAWERSYNLFLDLVLLVLPLLILCAAYILITRTLYVSMQHERAMIFGGSTNLPGGSQAMETVATVTTTLMPSSTGFNLNMSFRCHTRNGAANSPAIYAKNYADTEHAYQQQLQTQAQSQSQSQHRDQQRYYEDVTHAGSKGKLLAPADGHRYLYCMRTASIKSQQRNGGGHGGGASGSGSGGGGGGNVLGGMALGIASTTPSMTVINLPQQQRFKLHQQRHCHQHQLQQQQQQQGSDDERRKTISMSSLRLTEAALRRSNVTKNLESKKRVVKMLFVLVLEFFICWTPLYVINTMAMFIGPAFYEYVDYTAISFFQLLAYSSSCCNPITYCFMNAGFRRAFLDTFRGVHFGGAFWRRRPKHATGLAAAGNSIALANSVTMLTNNTVLDSPRL